MPESKKAYEVTIKTKCEYIVYVESSEDIQTPEDIEYEALRLYSSDPNEYLNDEEVLSFKVEEVEEED